MSKQQNFRNVDRGYDRSAQKAEMQSLIEDELFGGDAEVSSGLVGLMEPEAEANHEEHTPSAAPTEALASRQVEPAESPPEVVEARARAGEGAGSGPLAWIRKFIGI